MLLSVSLGASVPELSDATIGGAPRDPRLSSIIVNTSDDVVDFGGAQQVVDLPGPDGKVSLAEAGLASDNTMGVQTIGFHIPQNEWINQQFYPGRAVLSPFLGFRLFDTAIVDGTTQTTFTGETNPEGGAEVVISSGTYLIDNIGGGMFGFDSSSITLSGGASNVIQGNTKSGVDIYDSDSNLIGGANPGQGNTGGYIKIDQGNDNVVVGNTVGRVRVLGWMGGGQPATNNRIGGPSVGERNFITGLGTLNSQGIPGGFGIQLFDSIGTIIENNSIGTTPDGMQQGHPWTTAGIYFDSENHNTTIRDNRIAGIDAIAVPPHGPSYHVGTAIQLYGMGSGVSIVGNTIGLNANDEPVLGSVTGISTVHFFYPDGIQGVVIGGSAPGEGNEIAGHLGVGISVANTYSGVRISGNSIHDNGGLGIDLVTSNFEYGVTPNDSLDADAGGNLLQNFPVLDTALRTASTSEVRGTLSSTPNTVFTIEFFLSAAADPTGYGEGQTYLGNQVVTTDANGTADVAFSMTNPVPVGYVITATATDPTGNTSEFGPAVTIPPDVSAPIFDGPLSLVNPDAANAYVLPTGNGEQLRTPDITGIRQLQLYVSEDLVIDAADVTLSGVEHGSIPIQSMTFDPVTNRIDINFVNALPADEYTLSLNSDGPSPVTDSAGNRFDGEWDNPTSLADPSSSGISGNGLPGGNLNLRFNILSGDANRDNMVTGADFTIWADNFGAGPGATLAQGDFNGDGFVTGADFTIWNDLFGSDLTGADEEPDAVTIPAVATPLLGTVRRAQRLDERAEPIALTTVSQPGRIANRATRAAAVDKALVEWEWIEWRSAIGNGGVARTSS